jgi:hypothetical protein
MSAQCCPHEREVLDLVAIGQWPSRADAALLAHVSGCASCEEVASVAAAVREWGETAPVARMPEASVVWHRAQLRARSEAVRTANRPVWVAQGFALASLIVGLAWAGPSAAWYASVWQRLSGAAPRVSLGLPESTVLSVSQLPAGWGWSVLMALGGVVLLITLVMGALRISEHSEIPDNK